MKNASIFLVGAVAVVFAVTFTRPAWALGPIDIEVGAKVGGASNDTTGGGTNPLGLGFGGRAGVSFFGIYGGVTAMYYLGGSQTVSAAGVSLKASESSYFYGIEGGYSFKLLLLTLRPTIGIGNYTVHASVSGTGIFAGAFSTGDTNNVYIEPGVTGLVGFGLWFVGADADLFFLPGLDGSKVAFMANGQIGVKF